MICLKHERNGRSMPVAIMVHYTGEGGLAIGSLKPGVALNHIGFKQVRCGNERDDSEWPSITKVTGGSGIQTSDPFGDKRVIYLTAPAK